MSVEKVSIVSVELDEPLDEAGFRHVATSVGDRLGARRIGASVYPDSDKISGPEGIHLRKSAVGYWHGEGTAGPSESVEIVREPETSPPQPAVNVLAVRAEAADPHAPPGFRYRAAKLGPLLGADRLDGWWWSWIPERDPSPTTTSMGGRSGCWSWPESPRCATGKVRIISGPAISYASRKAQPVLTGCSIAASRSRACVLFLSTTGLPANACYPDTGRWLIRNGLGRDDVVVREIGPLGPNTANSGVAGP